MIQQIVPTATTRPATPVQANLVRVLHLINGEHYSGAERVQDLLACRLPELGYEVGLACLKPGRFPHLRQARHVPLYEVPMWTRLDLRAVLRVARIVRREGYALLHAHTPRTALVGRLVAAWTGVPMVYHVHSPTLYDTTGRWRNRLNHLAERFSLTAASHLITVSASLAEHMQRAGYSADRLSVVPNGVPPVACGRGPEPPRGVWTLGTVALFRPRKGLEVLLEALALLHQQDLPVQLRAVGPFETPQYEAELKSRVARLGLEQAVRWTGFTRDVAAELARLDLFVLPSLFGEGLPMVVLEAMAAGLPVVGTRVEGVPEAIRDGSEGLLAVPDDPADLARAIAQCVRGQVDWSRLRSNAQTRHRERFSDHSMAAGVAAVYQRCQIAGACHG